MLPDSGSIYLDANCFIDAVEKIEPHAQKLAILWEASRAGRLSIVTSDLTVMEAMIKPLRAGDHQLQLLFMEVLTEAPEVRLLPCNLQVFLRAARFRAELGLKTPDAVHAATAEMNGCAALVSNDLTFKKLTAMPVLSLDEL